VTKKQHRSLRWMVWLAVGILVPLLSIAGFTLWSLNTAAGTRMALNLAQRVLAGTLRIEQVQGTLAGPLTVRGVRYRDPRKGIDFQARELSADLALAALLQATVHVERLSLQDAGVILSEPTEPPPPSKPFSLDPPLDVRVDDVTVRDFKVQRDATPLLVIDAAAVSGSWTGAGLRVSKLDVRSPDGEVHFTGSVRGQQVYLGEGRGSFRWTVGPRLYAGTLEAGARDVLTNLRVRLSSPLDARLAVQFKQQQGFPWQLTLQVPRFDPREELLPDSSLQSLYASLRGSGTLDKAELSGRLAVNDQPLQVEHIRATRGPEKLDLAALFKLAGGSIDLQGVLVTKQTPAAANLTVNWRDLVIPEQWAGQVLNSKGQLRLEGSAADYRANGALSLGPPRRMADIELRVRGSDQQIHLEQLDIQQAAGRMALTGNVVFKPQVAWQVTAQARRFDPGAFAAAWPGNLNFALASDGRLLEQGPQATLQLRELRGKLRGRQLNGHADLSMTPDMNIAGGLSLRSGSSQLSLQGQRGAVMNARLNIDVPSLNDWLPDGGGKLAGRITARGRWPEMNVAGQLDGSGLRWLTTTAKTLGLRFDVRTPKTPAGRLQLEATELRAANLNFTSLALTVDGSDRSHNLRLSAPGRPLSAELSLTGQRQPDGWSGSLRTLVLDVRRAARLQLQQPVALKVSAESMSASMACLADRDVRLCVEGETQSNGVLHAKYSARNVPLALADTFGSDDLPMTFAGTLDGDGNVWRSERGELNGSVQLSSRSGQVARRPAARGDEPDVLLEYADMNITAKLAGSRAQAQLRSQINRSGSLQGQVELSGLGGAAANIRGTLAAELPSLTFVELFTPQLANVAGQARVRASIAGTLPQPRIDGELQATELAADVPTVGLKLSNGRLSAKPRSAAGEFDLAGAITSGGGEVSFDGVVTTAGTAQIKVRGDGFLAADIPGAKVVINPDLEFVRTAERMTLSGDVHLPAADVDLQKLPRGRQRTQNSSPDVVIIDAKTQQEVQMESIPLFAAINVSLSDRVNLTGFGLQAKVTGRLAVREAPGAPTTGSGQVQVTGTYKAYGQDLTIREGQLFFAATPLSNPRLNLVAVREVDEITAGIRVVGYAQQPQLTVFSEPAMGQSNALSYLVAGKPLSDIGAGDSDGDAVQSAARSLGTAAGGLLAKNIGRRLGVDEITVKENEAIGGAALTVGQYLSPRLYLSYGVGLFDPGEVLTLRYKLSRDLALEALNGPEGTRAGIDYRREK
jgi:translocation and assembly module TamB